MERSGIRRGSMNWICLAQDREMCGALVSIVFNIQIPENIGIFMSI
jgi:hypothetical protein